MEKILNVKDLLGEFTEGTFLERQNRFVAKVSVNGKLFNAHVADTGRMRELLLPGTKLILAKNPRGKLDFKLVAVEKEGEWVLLNTSIHSKIAEKIIEKGYLGFVPSKVEREIVVNKSRIDFRIDGNFYVEVKGCNLSINGVCLFPDAPTERGRKHLKELIKLKERGFRTAVLFLMFRKCKVFKPNDKTDPDFAKVFTQALKEGVEFFAFHLSFNPETGWIHLEKAIKQG